ncbi:ABC transporter ATP-binding protein [uncultured Sphaerochaeta sp.]|uniref:ABC transporter ATP-binding protein n=1 Tax=uncultured Sphaerochaeta sp. TaxID=886478 RepID=UPI0029CA8E05|nr:ABC transporter ATP-binding protein [uncultured Sphaerochaeta sp.]
MAIVEIHDIRKQYGPVQALDGVSLSVEDGTVFGFLGPNGAGKSTLIKILTGLLTPSSGSYTIAGKSGIQSKQSLGYLAQQPAYYGWMTAKELLEISGDLYGMNRQERDERIVQLLEFCGIADAADRRIGGYSGGMRQRLGIAQAILHRPSVVFLDEPVSALDPVGRKEVLSLIATLRKETTIFMSSHILDDVQRVCDEVAIINKGSIRIHEKTKTLLRLHAKPIMHMEFTSMEEANACVKELSDSGLQASVKAFTVSLSSDLYAEHANQILLMISQHNWRLVNLHHQEATLEDVFMHHIQETTNA